MRAGLLFSIGLVVLATGCHDREPEGFAKFIPAPATARQALSKALEAWREGEAPGPIDNGTSKLFLIDARRQGGRKLAAFEVIGEVSADNARGFAARLTFDDDGPEESPTSRYLVVGIDPLWIYRQEDLDMFCHWMHAMDEPKKDSP
jgi:hypothetical protein